VANAITSVMINGVEYNRSHDPFALRAFGFGSSLTSTGIPAGCTYDGVASV